MTTTDSQQATAGAPSLVKLPVIAALVAIVCLAYIYFDGLSWMVKKWDKEEYSHGYLIPLIAFVLLWMRSSTLKNGEFRGTWLGPIAVLLALGAFVLGELSSIYQIIQYGFLLALFGLILSAIGWKGFIVIWVPFVYLLFMVPLPAFVYQGLSSALQLLSSELGVAVIRLFGISVFLEGNVIDLGIYQLQVAEACNGLRYLFPLMSFGFLCAAIYEGPWWQRGVIFLSSIPITIFMNSFRIGVIGVLVNSYGIEQAEGFLHDFEGWVVFMACVGLLFLEMWAFAKLRGKQLSEVFGLEIPPYHTLSDLVPRRFGVTSATATVVLLLGVAMATSIQSREVQIPERESFSSFPLSFGQWTGRSERIRDRGILKNLAADDYLLVNYKNAGDGSQIGLWMAYYAEQRKGRAVHSPRACLPGGGWQIESYDQYMLRDIGVAGTDMKINRAVIAMGDVRQLVYFWFVERGRIQTNEYAVKWQIFWDALTLNRTEGALVRISTFVPDVAYLDAADERLLQFVREVEPMFSSYLPGRETTFETADVSQEHDQSAERL